MDSLPQSPHQPTDDSSSVAKSSTSSGTAVTTPPAPSPPPPHPIPTDYLTCCVCLEDLQVDASTFARMNCCGKATHLHCCRGVQTSTMPMEQKSTCPECRAKIPTTDKGRVKQLRVWVEKGKAWAQTHLANKYKFGAGVRRSYKEAIHYHEMAIKQGDPNAMCELADMYEHGEGVAKSSKKATELLTMAARRGHMTAQYNAGIHYENGVGVAQSYKKATDFYALAANQGFALAQVSLGTSYVHGQGVAQSNSKAREWWLKAALQEHEDAIENLKILDEQEGKTTPTLACCAACGRPTSTRRPLRSCPQCLVAQYCSRECQVKHWKDGHKRECKRLQTVQKKKKPPAGEGEE